MDDHGNLVIPLSVNGQLSTVQRISATGEKKLAKGLPKKGASFQIGDGDGDTIYICEGYATAASIYEATGGCVYMAVDAGNLLPAAENLREQYPKANFVFCADNDPHDKGLVKACEAARAVDGLVCMPDTVGHDFNDVHAEQGLDAVWELIEQTAEPPDIEPEPEEKKKKRTVADILVDLVPDDSLFHDADGKAYADVKIDGHRETWAVRSKAFKNHLSFQLFQTRKKTPASQSLQDALGTIEGKALFLGPERAVHVRIGEHDGSIYLDLGRPDWSAIEITAEGWRVVTNPAIRFWRPSGLRPLPEPARDGDVRHLINLLNVDADKDFKLIVGWLLSALRPSGPYPVMTFGGEQGTGKSTAGRILRSLIDLNVANLRTTARSEQDLIIASKNGWIIALDNQSGVKPWLSDALCRIATGGGFGTRRLYTDDDEILIEVQRPIIINGIEELCTRGDLADRAIVVELPVISQDKRVTEKRLNRLFESANRSILGGLLDAVVSGLKCQDEIKLTNLPRMADAAVWWCACERGRSLPWDEGGILGAFQGSRESIIESFVETDDVAAGIAAYLQTHGHGFEGTASKLLATLNQQRGDDRPSKFWPNTPKSLSGRIRRASSFLREYGIAVETRRIRKGRMIYINYISNSTSRQSPQSPENKTLLKTGS